MAATDASRRKIPAGKSFDIIRRETVFLGEETIVLLRALKPSAQDQFLALLVRQFASHLRYCLEFWFRLLLRSSLIFLRLKLGRYRRRFLGFGDHLVANVAAYACDARRLTDLFHRCRNVVHSI